MSEVEVQPVPNNATVPLPRGKTIKKTYKINEKV